VTGGPRRGPAAVAIALALSGCAPDPRRTIGDATEGALSWASSAHLAVEGWTDRRLSTRFTRAALERCQRGLEEERASLASAPDLADARVATAAREIAEMSALTAARGEAVEKEDPDAVARSAAALSASAARLREGPGA